MSWETYTIIYISFKKDVSDEKIDEILLEFEDVAEGEFTELDCKTFNLSDINWSSHVRGENINDVFEKYKEYIESFDMSIYYLNEADEVISYNDGELLERYLI